MRLVALYSRAIFAVAVSIAFPVVLACGGQTEAIRSADVMTDADAPGPPAMDAGVSGERPDADAAPRAGGRDGVCTPGSVSSGILDPDCVYLLGTLKPGEIGHQVLIFPTNPADRAFGFGDVSRRPFVRPTDGRVVFQAGQHAYTFTTSVGTSSGIEQQLAAQTLLPTPGCGRDDSLYKVFVFPDDGETFYECIGFSVHWHVGTSTTPLFLDYLPFAVAEDRSFIGQDGTPEYFLVRGRSAVRVLDGGYTNLFAWRASPGGGFLVALSRPGVRAELRRVEASGESILGNYDFGEGAGGGGGGGHCVLEPTGAMVCITTLEQDGGPQDGVVRFSTTGPPEILYDERTSDVKIHIAELVTGP
jgi:hypothetical protein